MPVVVVIVIVIRKKSSHTAHTDDSNFECRSRGGCRIGLDGFLDVTI